MADEHLHDVRERVMDIQERLSMQKMSDHDLLIRLSTQSEGISVQLAALGASHATQATNIDSRLRTLEQTPWLMLGAAGAIGALAGFLVRVLHP